MTEALADRDRQPSEALFRLYRRWADSGAGLLITGNVGVDRAHPVRARDVMLDQHSDLSRFRVWAELCKASGARVVMQLNHAGRQTPRFTNPRPLGPSEGAAVPVMGAFGRPRAASEAEIAQVIRAHAEAAARAEYAGFDGVQIHAAHGYLINQFLAPDVNQRNDSWGGDLRGRARLLLEIVRAVRAATKGGFSLLVKLNSADFSRSGLSAGDALAIVGMLSQERIDLLEISGGRYESGAAFGYNVEGSADEGYFAAFARRARSLSDLPFMLTGGLRTGAAMQRALSEGSFDVAGIARPMLLDPHFPRALLEGRATPAIAARALGVARLESAAELAWWYAQLARLAAGGDAAKDYSPLRALLGYFWSEAYEGTRLRWSLARGLRALPRPLATALASRDETEVAREFDG